MRPLRVGLVSTAAVNAPGSMRAYADLLMQAMTWYAPEVEARLLELDPHPSVRGWRQRADTLMLPWRARRLSTSKPDLWHILDGSRAYLAEGLRGAPVVITAHDIIPVLQQRGRFPGAPTVGRAARWLWRRNGKAMRTAALLICDSECTRRDVTSEFGAPLTASVVPLPVRHGLVACGGGELPIREPGLILHLGNNGFYKNRAQVLRIFAALDRSLARRLVMIGPAPAPALRELASALGIEAWVQWVEDAEDVQVANWYHRASVLVFPSLYEGYGWPVLEAMAFGLPVVCSNAGSLPEVAGDVAPCLAPDDLAGFVREIEWLLRDSAVAQRRAEAGRRWAEGFGLERFARDMSAAYRAACDGVKR